MSRCLSFDRYFGFRARLVIRNRTGSAWELERVALVVLLLSKRFFFEFGDFGIVELFLLNLKWLLEEKQLLEVFAEAHLFPKGEGDPHFP